MPMTFLTSVHQQTLEALARYKFLTTGQLLWLGIMSDRANLNREIKKVRDRKKPLLSTISFGVHPKMGKLESFHTLTVHGASYLMEEMRMEEQEIKYLKGLSSIFHRDYFHRLSQINFMIALDLWTMDHACEVSFFDTYFDTTGNANKNKNLVSKTKIEIADQKALYADGIFMIETETAQHLFAMEMYRGKDTGRVMQQLRSYVYALAEGSISTKYQHTKGVRVLLVFDQQSNMESVLNHVNTEPFFEHMRSLFLFKAYADTLNPTMLGFWVSGEKEVVGIVD